MTTVGEPTDAFPVPLAGRQGQPGLLDETQERRGEPRPDRETEEPIRLVSGLKLVGPSGYGVTVALGEALDERAHTCGARVRCRGGSWLRG